MSFSIASKGGALPVITLTVPKDQVKSVISALEKGESVIEEADFYKHLLWLAQHIFSSAVSLESLGLNNPSAVITTLGTLLKAESHEI